MSLKDKIVLSYHESVIRESDLEILRGPRWLNDVLISFYFEYLEAEKFKNHPSILFISPEVTQCIKVTPVVELEIFLEPLGAKRKDFIFLALNDNVRPDCSGGSHWSLLVFSRPENACYHFDSHTGSNYEQARDLGNKLLRYFGMLTHGQIFEGSCLQQTNGYDCGVHVICNVEHIAKYALLRGRINGCGIVDGLKVANKRADLLDLIKRLKKTILPS